MIRSTLLLAIRLREFSSFVGRCNPGGYTSRERRPRGLWGWRIDPVTAWRLARAPERWRTGGVGNVRLWQYLITGR